MTAITRLQEINAHDDASAPIEPVAVEVPEPGWVETPTSRKIYRALVYARATPTLALIYGSPGVSKTTTALRFAKDHDPASHEQPAYYINLLGVKSSAAMLKTIHGAIRTRHYVDAYVNATLMRSLAKELSPCTLLILDEAQHLRPDALDSVRYFLDEGRVGLVLMGNEIVASEISSKRGRAHFAQLSSRIGLRLHVPHPTEADADAVLKAWGVAGGLARDYGREIALGPGGLRQLTQVLRHTRILAAAKKQPLDHQLMHAAANALGLIDR